MEDGDDDTFQDARAVLLLEEDVGSSVWGSHIMEEEENDEDCAASRVSSASSLSSASSSARLRDLQAWRSRRNGQQQSSVTPASSSFSLASLASMAASPPPPSCSEQRLEVPATPICPANIAHTEAAVTTPTPEFKPQPNDDLDDKENPTPFPSASPGGGGKSETGKRKALQSLDANNNNKTPRVIKTATPAACTKKEEDEYDVSLLVLANDTLVNQLAESEARRLAECSRLRQERDELKTEFHLQEMRFASQVERLHLSMQEGLMSSLEKINRLTAELEEANNTIALLQQQQQQQQKRRKR